MPKITVPIFADGDREHLRELEAAVGIAQRNTKANTGISLRGGDTSPDEEVTAAQAAYDAFLDEAAERAEAWVLDHIGFRQFRKLLKDNPPRTTTETAEDGTVTEKIDPADEAWGVNTETFPEALLLYVDREDDDMRTVVELKQGTVNIAKNADKLRKRVGRLSEGQVEALWGRAYWLNKAGVSDPKLERFSPATQRSSGT
ncbi:MAG: hypothetical protein ACRDTJ_04350 [Pseudonocardiaceae bacterium]